MTDRGDRRLWFFLIAAVVCLLLVPVAPHGLEWVPAVTAAAYVVLAALVALDSFGRRSRP
jgi:hypothetical protein